MKLPISKSLFDQVTSIFGGDQNLTESQKIAHDLCCKLITSKDVELRFDRLGNTYQMENSRFLISMTQYGDSSTMTIIDNDMFKNSLIEMTIPNTSYDKISNIIDKEINNRVVMSEERKKEIISQKLSEMVNSI